jgi:hypothetical protein
MGEMEEEEEEYGGDMERDFDSERGDSPFSRNMLIEAMQESVAQAQVQGLFDDKATLRPEIDAKAFVTEQVKPYFVNYVEHYI